MDIAVSESSAIEVIHRESRIYCGDFKRPVGNINLKTSKEINKYWSLLPIEEQDKIFDVYKDASALFSNELDQRNIMRGVQDIMIRLLDDLHPFDRVDEIGRQSCLYHSPVANLVIRLTTLELPLAQRAGFAYLIERDSLRHNPIK